jgi:hypothetical protein
MWKRLISRKVPPPRLVIAQRVIDKMQAAAQQFTEDETGEAMIGLIVPDGMEPPTIYVLDTIAPDESAIREGYTFQQGDGWQDEMIWWYQENWHHRRQNSGRGLFRGKDAWDVPLRYLGDWHKQPGYMIAPSGGDLQTAIAWLHDPAAKSDLLLVPILTTDHPATVDPESANVNYVVVEQEDGTAMRVDWWFVHRDGGIFQPVEPSVVPDDDVPALTPPPWHLTDPKRAETEIEKLGEAEMAVSMLVADTDGDLPLEFCFSITPVNNPQKIYLIATPHDYPASPPVVRTLGAIRLEAGQAVADVFMDWWEQGDPFPLPFPWQDDCYLIDIIKTEGEADELGSR